jgi:hypothetical protein
MGCSSNRRLIFEIDQKLFYWFKIYVPADLSLDLNVQCVCGYSVTCRRQKDERCRQMKGDILAVSALDPVSK